MSAEAEFYVERPVRIEVYRVSILQLDGLGTWMNATETRIKKTQRDGLFVELDYGLEDGSIRLHFGPFVKSEEVKHVVIKWPDHTFTVMTPEKFAEKYKPA